MPSLTQLRQQHPEFEGVSDQGVFEHVASYYPHIPKYELAKRMGYDLPLKTDTTGDILKGIGEGALRTVGQDIPGLLDVGAGFMGYDRPVSRLAGEIGEATGFQPTKWANETPYSEATTIASQEVDKAWNDPETSGIDVAKAIINNPRALLPTVAGSVAPMVAGAGVGRALMKAGAPAMAALAGGEGAISAGAQMANIDQSVDPVRAAQASTATGLMTSILTIAGNKAAKALGVGDIEAELLGIGNTGRGGIGRRVGGGALAEGLLEEAPQSAYEQIAKNYVEGKPQGQGVARAAVEGAAAGAVFGAGANIAAGHDTLPIEEAGTVDEAIAGFHGAVQGKPKPESEPAAPIHAQAPQHITDIITEAAQRHGVDPDTMMRIAGIETGGKFNPDAYNKGSGASGLFQFMPLTAKQYGLDNPFDAEKSADAAARLAKDNAASLFRALGRAPTPGELYLAHQQGAGGAAKLLVHPDEPARKLVGLQAVIQNGGKPGMTAREFASLWINKAEAAKGIEAKAKPIVTPEFTQETHANVGTGGTLPAEPDVEGAQAQSGSAENNQAEPGLRDGIAAQEGAINEEIKTDQTAGDAGPALGGTAEAVLGIPSASLAAASGAGVGIQSGAGTGMDAPGLSGKEPDIAVRPAGSVPDTAGSGVPELNRAIPLEKLADIVKSSPTPDLNDYRRETIKAFQSLLPLNPQQDITTHDLADAIASTYDLSNPENRVAYSVLKEMPPEPVRRAIPTQKPVRTATKAQTITPGTFHPAIEGMVKDLSEGGGVSYLADQHGRIAGRTPSTNPDWFQNWTMTKDDGGYYKKKPSVKEIKLAFAKYQEGKGLNPLERRILKNLSEIAKAEEEDYFTRQEQQTIDFAVEFAEEMGMRSMSEAEFEEWLNGADTTAKENAGGNQPQAGGTAQAGLDQAAHEAATSPLNDLPYNSGRTPSQQSLLDEGPGLADKQALADLARQKDLKRQGQGTNAEPPPLFSDNPDFAGQQDIADLETKPQGETYASKEQSINGKINPDIQIKKGEENAETRNKNQLQEGAQTVRGNLEKSQGGNAGKISHGMAAIKRWLQAVSGNDSQAISDIEGKMFGQHDSGELQRKNLLKGADTRWLPVSTSGDNGKNIRETLAKVGTRSPQGRQWLEQQSGKLGDIDSKTAQELARHITSDEVGEIIRSMREMPNNEEKARSAWIVHSLLSTKNLKDKEKILRGINHVSGNYKETTAPDAGRGEQPEIRQESGDTAKGRTGIQPKANASPAEEGTQEKEIAEADLFMQDILVKGADGTVKKLNTGETVSSLRARISALEKFVDCVGG